MIKVTISLFISIVIIVTSCNGNGKEKNRSGASNKGGSGGTGSASNKPVDSGVAEYVCDSGDNISNDADGATGDDIKEGGASTDVGKLDRFSFFVTSYQSLTQLSGSEEGFGGDLRYGEATGLAGADKICSEIAEISMPGAASKGWRAFLSTTKGGKNGGPVHAIKRIGSGPWYDRLGRLVANNRAELQHSRPLCAHPAIKMDLPNEFGVPNHDPYQTGPIDNHHTMTGSTAKGMLYTKTYEENPDPSYSIYSTSDAENNPTCDDWTKNKGAGGPRVGLSWARWGGSDATGFGVEWISEMFEGGCEPGFNSSGSRKDGTARVGSGGGYGQFYCFALTP